METNSQILVKATAKAVSIWWLLKLLIKLLAKII